MMIGELEDGNLIEIEDDNEVDFLEVILEEGVMAKTKKVKFHGMELSISKKRLQDRILCRPGRSSKLRCMYSALSEAALPE